MITILSLHKYSQLVVIADELKDLRKRLDTELIARLKADISTLNKQYTKQVMKLSQLFWNVDDLKVAVDKLTTTTKALEKTERYTLPRIEKHNYIIFHADEIIGPLREIKHCLENVDEFKHLIKNNINDLKSIVEPVKYIISRIEKGIEEYEYNEN
jgi:archaellum component FlaC